MSSRSHQQSFKDKVNEWLYDHHFVKTGMDWFYTFVVSTISAIVFAFGFNTFISPNLATVTTGNFISGGLSGFSQVFVLILQLFGWRDIDTQTAFSILYFVFNVPLVILAFFGIGKRFAIFTLINVAEVSIFTRTLTTSYVPWMGEVATFVSKNGGILARALFAGVTTGLSSAICFKVDISAGGIDVISYYIALKKGTMVGKYSVVINATNLTLFVILSTIKAVQYENLGIPLDSGISSLTATLSMVESDGTMSAVPIITSNAASSDPMVLSAHQFGSALVSILYFFTAMLVIDRINVRNKKLKIEIITSNKDLGEVLISSVPHGATILTGEGVYTGQVKYLITMVVSSYEVKKLTKIIREEDPTSFVQVTELSNVVGRFFMKPIK